MAQETRRLRGMTTFWPKKRVTWRHGNPLRGYHSPYKINHMVEPSSWIHLMWSRNEPYLSWGWFKIKAWENHAVYLKFKSLGWSKLQKKTSASQNLRGKQGFTRFIILGCLEGLTFIFWNETQHTITPLPIPYGLVSLKLGCNPA